MSLCGSFLSCFAASILYFSCNVKKPKTKKQLRNCLKRVILSVSEECIPRREVTIRCNDKIWFDSNIRREIRKRDRFHRKYLKLKTALSQTIFKQQRIRSTRREPPTMGKQLVSLITYSCQSSAPVL